MSGQKPKEATEVELARMLRQADLEMFSAPTTERRRILATEQFANYCAKVAAGFTPEQALNLVK